MGAAPGAAASARRDDVTKPSLLLAAFAEASSLAPWVDALFGAWLLVSFIVIAGLFLAIVFLLVRYRRGSDAPRPPIRIAPWKLETGWITGTTLVFLGFFA